MALTLEGVVQFSYENLELAKVNYKSGHVEIHSRCPLCGDSKKSQYKKRFHMKVVEGETPVYYCFNCGQGGDFYSLYSHIKGVTREQAWRKFNSFSPENIKNKFQKHSIREEKKEAQLRNFDSILDVCLDRHAKPEAVSHKILVKRLNEFIDSRKIEVPVYVAYRDDYRNRFIIPVIQDGHIIYFQARAMADGVEPKYLCPEAEKSHIILNHDNFDREKFIVIAEGFLDAYSVGNQGTAVIGASASDDFLHKVMSLTDKGVILALDNDETGLTRMSKVLEESKYRKQLRYFLMNKAHKDIKDLNELKVKTDLNIYDYVLENSHDFMGVQLQLKLRR